MMVSRGSTAYRLREIGNELKCLVSEKLYDEALKLYKQKLHPLGVDGFAAVLPSVIKACSFQRDRLFGAQLHCLCLRSAFDRDTVVSNSLVSMYVKFDSAASARKVFNEMPERDTISYCSMVNSCSQERVLSEALKLLKEMYLYGFVPKPELVAAVLSLCTRMGSRKTALMLHALVLVDERMPRSVVLSTALVDAYLKIHDPTAAFCVFGEMEVKNEVSWTTIISGCVADHNYEMGIDLFRVMQREGVKPNRVTLMSILPACIKMGSRIRRVKEIHGFALHHGFHSDHHFTAALMNTYCKCGLVISYGRLLFKTSEVRDVVMWSSIIGSYAETGDCAEAMTLFSQMRKEGIEPNFVTLLAMVSACAYWASLNHACGIHGHITKCGFTSDVSLGNSLIDMYSKCGNLEAAHKVFDELNMKDVISWSSLISACGLNGQGLEAVKLFQNMVDSGVEIDIMAFLAVLSACNHAGLVEEAQCIFMYVVERHKVPLTLEHYACYIDLLGKSGKIDDAFGVIRNMPMKPSARIWSSLVSACKIHSRLDVAGKTLANQLMESEPDNPANYALLSMIHAESGDWHGAEEVRRVMWRGGLNKCHGFSRIELQ